jgi:formylglycine-generating enzyme required for sulfatase activity
MNDLNKLNIVMIVTLVIITIWLALLQGSVNSFQAIFGVIEKEQDSALKAIQTAQDDAINAIETHNTQLKAMLTVAENRLATLNQKTSHAQQELARINQEAETKFKSQSETITQTQQALERLTERKEEILADIQSDKKLSEVKKQLHSLTQEMTQIKEGITQLNQQKEELITEIKAAKPLADAEKRLFALNQGITTATQTLAQITARQEKILSDTQMAAKLAQAEHQLKTLYEQIAKAQQELEQMTQRKETLDAQAQTTQNELAQAKQELNVLNQKSAQAQQALNSLTVQKTGLLVELQKTMMVLHDSFGTAHSKITTVLTKTIEDEPALTQNIKKTEPVMAEPKESQIQKPVAQESDKTPVVKETLKPAVEEPIAEGPIITEDPVAFTPKMVVSKDGKTFSDVSKDESLGPKMVWIPKGEFKMGTLQAQSSDYNDQIVQKVVIKQRFAIGVYEVTFAQYDKFAEATGRQKPDDKGWGRDNRPVINVSFDDALAYTQWLSEQTGRTYRLPTEAEWEYVARAGTETRYWWGNQIGVNQANCNNDCGDQFDRTSTVGHFAPNPFGLYDVVGNVREWTCSAYIDVYNGEEHVCTTNEKAKRVVRGGAWFLGANNVHIANRYKEQPDKRHIGVGFRVVREQ